VKKINFLFFVILFCSTHLYSQKADFTTTSTGELVETISVLEGAGCNFLAKEILHLISSYNSLVQLHAINPSSEITKALHDLEESLKKIQIYCSQLNDLIVFEHVIISPDEKAAPTTETADLQQILQSQQQQIINNLISSIQASNDALEKISHPNGWSALSIVGGVAVGVVVTTAIIVLCYYGWKALSPFDKEEEKKLYRERNQLLGTGKKLEKETFENAKILTETAKDQVGQVLKVLKNVEEKIGITEQNFNNNFKKHTEEINGKIEQQNKLMGEFKKELLTVVDQTTEETKKDLQNTTDKITPLKKLMEVIQAAIGKIQIEVNGLKSSVSSLEKQQVKSKLLRTVSTGDGLKRDGKE
jgi:hypothetical protein